MPSVEGIDNNVPPKGYGVYGLSTRGGYGVGGVSNTGYGVIGSSRESYAMWGESVFSSGVFGTSQSGYGVHGYSGASSGVYGQSNDGDGVVGETSGRFVAGVHGRSNNGRGVLAESVNGTGVYAASEFGVGLYAFSRGGDAARLDGDVMMSGGRIDMLAPVLIQAPVAITGPLTIQAPVNITGPLTKPVDSFKIDHPLDPANKYLYHSVVESPDMKNVYDGVVTLDNKGEAEIELPDWFGALNKDFRYQLTAIGAPGPNLHISSEISDTTTVNYSRTRSNKNKNNSRFKVAGGTSGMKVSWQVTGIRKDPYANAHRIRVEGDKPDKERGYYIYPELYGQPEEKGISHLLVPEIERKSCS